MSSFSVSACARLLTGIFVHDETMWAMSSSVTLSVLSCRSALLGPLLFEPLLLEAQLLLAVANRGGLLELLRLDDRLFLGLDLADLVVDLADLGRRKGRLKAHARRRLVDQVDRFVRQEAIGDVAVAELRRGDQRLVGDRDLVVRFVAVAQALEDLDRLFDRRLADHDRLEAALQRRVLLDVLAELVERRRADALQLAARQRRLDDVGGVDRAFGGARTDQRVKLVDEQDDLAGRAADLVHHALHALFEFAAILRAGDQPGEVERDDALVAQRLGDVALDDALGQPSAIAVLPTPGSPIRAGLFLVRRLRIWITRSISLASRPITGSSLFSRARAVRSRPYASSVGVFDLPLGAGRLTLGAQQGGRLNADLGRVDPEVGQDARGDALALADQAQQQVLGADVVVVELAGLFEGELDHALGARVKTISCWTGLAAPADDRLDLLANLGQVDAERLEDFGRQALALGDDAEQDVLGPDVVVAEPLRLFLRQHDAAPRALGERFPH